MKFFFICILSFLFLSSCFYTSASYGLVYHNNLEKINLCRNDKFILINNNIITDDYDFLNKVNKDFANLLGANNISIVSKNNFLELANKKFVTKFILDKNTLSGIRNTSKSDYLIFVRIFGKSSTRNKVEKDIFFKIENRKDFDEYREYHVIIQLYDLKKNKILYNNVSISVFERKSLSGMSPSEMSQLKQTYNKIFKHFNKVINFDCTITTPR